MDVLREIAYFHTTSNLFSSCFYFEKVQRIRLHGFLSGFKTKLSWKLLV